VSATHADSSQKPFDSHGQGVHLIHLFYCPHAALSMKTHQRTLVARLTQSNDREVLALLDVVRVARAFVIANAAIELFHTLKVCSLFCV
jgi:hypothetical protein